MTTFVLAVLIVAVAMAGMAVGVIMGRDPAKTQSFAANASAKLGHPVRTYADIEDVASDTTGPLALSGHSAGGHLASRMLDPTVLSAPVAKRLTSVVPISPLADLRPLLKTSMNDDFQLDPESAWAESLVAMSERHDARVTVWVGAEERPAFLEQARWLAHGWNVALVVAPNRHHFNVIEALSDPESDLVRRLVT